MLGTCGDLGCGFDRATVEDIAEFPIKLPINDKGFAKVEGMAGFKTLNKANPQ